MVIVIDFKREQATRGNKLLPERLRHIERYKRHFPNWTPEQIELLHKELESLGE
jgi:hypothetical protein